MSNWGRKMDEKPRQLTLSMSNSGSLTLRAGALRTKDAVREAICSAIAKSGLDREAVALELSRLVGEDVSKSTVDNWCAEGKHNRRFPLEYAAALAVITGGTDVLEAAIRPSGLRILNRDQAPYYELGVIVAEERARRKQKKQIEDRIGL